MIIRKDFYWDGKLNTWSNLHENHEQTFGKIIQSAPNLAQLEQMAQRVGLRPPQTCTEARPFMEKQTLQRLDFIWEPQRFHVVLKDPMGTSKIPWSPQRSHWILKDPMGSSSKIYKTRCTKGISIVLGDWHMLVYLKQIFSECFNGSLCICPAQDTTPLHLLSRIIGCHFCVSAFSIYAFCQNAVTSLIIDFGYKNLNSSITIEMYTCV